ncbi:medium-chain acyl-CoA ligase ACSF2, mitochondrial [Pectinophora gossypiella]|uniref:medium-chain acyl-CoA ligase ACSF2, mitochondrial n=1 Tax=Pectinophora gossypiella TaxID=13191 RepID=UPI00214E0DDB|nr:medium-chain acyl-CoA ligase ACSF2, mitochondrial [Pectinophora gossypiella]
MLSKTGLVASRLSRSVNLRLSRSLSSTKDSYLHNPGTEPLNYSTLGDVILETAHKYPGRVAVKSVHEGVTLTYEELLTQADRLGCALRAQGLEKGDRIGIWSHNNSAWIIALVAAARVGLISAAINPLYEKSELSFCIKKTAMKSIIFGEELPNRSYYNMLRSLIPELDTAKPGALKSDRFPSLTSIISCDKRELPGTTNINTLIADHSSNEVSKYSSDVTSRDGCIIQFTSGTTGEPKAPLDSHCGVVNNTYFVGKRFTFHEGHHKVCLQAPMFHALGSIITVLGTLRHGSTLVIAAPTYNVHANLNALISEECTTITGTPTMFVDMLSALRSKGDVPSKLRVAVAAGAPCSPQLIRDIQGHLKARSVLALYGLTESTACIFSSLPDDNIDMVAETVGYIQDHVEVKVVDEEGKPVPMGAPGELVSRGYNTMIGYWDEPKKTSDTVDKDGWLYTGDKFTISEDGYGRIVGRLKDIIVRGGENIAPKEIEDLLNTHPDIMESQVVGVSDERLGEELCAVLRVREGATVTVGDVAKHLTGRLARFKIPRLLKLTDQFPKTASGKIQKFKVKDMIEAGKL